MDDRRPKIQLIVSGDLEEECLPECLGKLFPEAEFLPAQRAYAFTTRAIKGSPVLEEGKSPHELKGYEMMSRMLAAIDPGAHGQPADYAIAVDDVEVENRANEPAILDHVRGLLSYLIERGPHDRRGNPLTSVRPDEPDIGMTRPLKNAERRRDALRNRCSFHLMAPMMEAPFFGDFAAVRRGCPDRPVKEPCFDPQVGDFELFETSDPGYLEKPDDWRPDRAAFAAKWARPNRRFHPKHYIEFLLDPNCSRRRHYDERQEGGAIMRALEWDIVFGPPDHGRFLRSLIHDVADMCGVPVPVVARGTTHPLTVRCNRGVLRNIARRAQRALPAQL